MQKIEKTMSRFIQISWRIHVARVGYQIIHVQHVTNDDSFHRDSPYRSNVAYVRQTRGHIAEIYYHNRESSRWRGIADILVLRNRETCACIRTMSCVRRICIRGRTEKYESFLRAINASAYSQGRPMLATAFIRPAGLPLDS